MEPVELEIKDEPMGHFNPVGWWVRGTTHFCSLWVKKCWLRGCTKLVQITDMCIYIYITLLHGAYQRTYTGAPPRCGFVLNGFCPRIAMEGFHGLHNFETYLTSPGAVNTREISSSLQKNGEQEIQVYLYFIISYYLVVAVFRRVYQNPIYLY